MIDQNIEDYSKNDSFAFYIVVAIFAHMAIVSILVVLQWLGGINIFDNSKKENVKVIQSAVRVDVVGMPKFTVQELKKMKMAPINTVEKVGNQKPAQDNTKSDLDFKKLSKKVGSHYSD